jgi:16S rRNA (cytosine967-C5)-methyltransferase
LRFLTRVEAIEALEEDGIEARISELSPYGIVADRGFLAGSELFQNGWLTIQDESSMLVAQAMQIEPGQRVLDACAAPGGKTTHIAALLNDEGSVTALDIHDHKLKLVRENAERLRVSDTVVTKKMDAREATENFPSESFDRILVDAPCSGLGLMRRKPDIKYQKQPQDFVQLPNIQLEILKNCAPTLKSGGILVYSTCTTAKEENQQVVNEFLNENSNFEKIDLNLEAKLEPAIHDQMLVLYPEMFMTDGFFICAMRKK